MVKGTTVAGISSPLGTCLSVCQPCTSNEICLPLVFSFVAVVIYYVTLINVVVSFGT